MTDRNAPLHTKRGGEPDAARLLELARAELLNELLPRLEGDARYRARLIAKALILARHELAAGAAGAASDAPGTDTDDTALAAFAGRGQGAASLTDALRGGALDGDAAFHALLVRLTERRRAALG